MLLTYRYLEELTDILTNMQRAMKLRGFEKKALDQRTLKMLSQLVGTLLLRSYEQSKRVYQAMVLRGYHYHKSTLFEHHALGDRSLSYVLVSSTLFISLGFVLTEITLRSSLAYFLIINLGN
jgi:cobalt/nickel transport system permease protein